MVQVGKLKKFQSKWEVAVPFGGKERLRSTLKISLAQRSANLHHEPKVKGSNATRTAVRSKVQAKNC